VQAILADDARATEIFYLPHMGAFQEVVQLGPWGSLHTNALAIAAVLPGSGGQALLRRIAEDRERSAPNPRTLAALTCPAKRVRIELEAQAIASLRIMAISLLRDAALFRRIMADSREPALVRHWASRMAKGPPAELDRRVLDAEDHVGPGRPGAIMAYSPCL
jgi:hypothetical protein